MYQYQDLDSHFYKLSKMQSEYQFGEISQLGILNHLFNNGDSLLYNDIFHFIDVNLESASFSNYFTCVYQRKIKHEISILNKRKIDAQSSSVDTNIIDKKISAAEEKSLVESIQDYKDQEEKDINAYVDILVSEYRFWNKNVSEEAAREHVLKFYFPYRIAGELYDSYMHRVKNNEMFDDRLPTIVKEKYLDKEINLMAIDKEFSSYKLVSFVDGMEIINAHDSQTLKDIRIPGWYLYLNIPRHLLSAIEYLLENQMASKIAFWINGVADDVPALEELEVGSYFSFDALALPPLSRLYDSENYNDKLWIKVEINEDEIKYPHSITFEEMCDEDVQVEGRIITQVIHLEFKKINSEYFISHLDHEFISYTTEQYKERRKNASIKGIRQKTFKIDDAQIPFEVKFEDKYFIFIVLDSLLKNKKNISEYFSQVLN
ncbi:hypothetical protein [Gluconobacter sp. Gdi]|uniref:hypothetical protein n=1 Tax=Gluconobacter sp. Gdi TaxID=2691888 RepID=UPI001762F264|nr:hypothetical protein [Gluconobacter sp. Gdi]GFE97857.1 hypothetical protein DmGdi_29300 [Gluconobacter sp. Gdi]